jgi:hypothetical protein
MAADDKTVPPEHGDKIAQRESLVGGGDHKRGLDQVVKITPQADAMTPQDAVAAGEPPAQDTKE